MTSLWVSAVAAIAVALAASCSSNDNNNMNDASVMPTPDVTMAECPQGATKCGDTCTVTKRDAQNCGACGKACNPGEVCVQGACALQCGGGSTKCNSKCVDTKSDPSNCGQCGTKCNPGEVCNVSKCALSCQPGLTSCMGACVDLQTDDDNCGVCGATCGVGQHCVAGKCTANCQVGWSSCPSDGGTTCVDLNSDNNNCGMCGNACAQGQFCSPGADGGTASCGLGCFGGTTKCGNQCVDLQIDPQNCGMCGQKCNGTCFNGQCCPGSQLYCNGACRNTKTDQNNCGGCGVVCAGPCNQGVCCNGGETICNGACSNTQFDPNNCGGCGTQCPMNKPNCAQGSCTTCPTTVLVLSDNHSMTNSAFVTKMQNAGLNPTLVNDGVYTYAGNPAAGNFGVTLIMVGDDYSNDMPSAGQQAIVNAQSAGKGVVVTDWGGYHVNNNRWQTLKSVTLFQYSTGTQATLDYKLEVANHPLWTGLPSSFTTTTSMGASTGSILNNGVRIAGCSACGSAGVIVRSSPNGRIVYVVHAANYSNNTTWTTDTNTVNLTINAVKWATGCLL